MVETSAETLEYHYNGS